MMEEHRIAMIASVAHEANRAYCSALGDTSQPRWVAAPQWQQDSAVAGVQAHLASDLTPEQSHEAWLAHKQADGWVYGPVKDPLAKQHPCCVPYDALPEEQRVKDRLFRNIVAAFKGAWEMTRRPYIKPPRSEDCVWRDGPPPGIGWWPASSVRNLNPIALRWWDGEWSCVALDSDSPKFAGLVASTRTGHADRDIRWTDRWWEDEHMSPLVAIQYLRRRAAISAGTNSGATTREATALLLLADLIQQLAAENAELRRALKLSGQVMRNSIGEDEK